jgi:glyoxalase family protein
VKKTVNFDAPEVYHLYYGDKIGSPGTIMTFFPYPGIPKGKKGKGQLTVTSFSISRNSLVYWMERFKQFGIPYEEPQTR